MPSAPAAEVADRDAPARARIDLPRGDRAHFAPLDGLRAVAIALVVVHHAFHAAPIGGPARLAVALADAGWCGVNLFFVLSGFLISGILLDARGTRGYFVNFYMRRSLRIFPLYYAFLAAFFLSRPAIVAWLGGAATPWPMPWIYWAYLSNMSQALGQPSPPSDLLAPLWSLAVEEQVYLAWPALVALAPRRWLPRIFAAMIPAALLFRLASLAGHQSVQVAYSWTPSNLDAFAAGAIVAWLLRRPDGPERLRAWAPMVLIGSGLFLAGLALGQRHFSFWYNPAVMLSAGLTGLSIFSAAAIAWIVIGGRGSAVGRLLAAPALRSVGRYSYAMYLFHTAAIHLIGAWARPRLPEGWSWDAPAVQAAFTVAVFAATYLAAAVSYHAFEKHFLRLKDRFPSAGRGVPAIDAAPAPNA